MTNQDGARGQNGVTWIKRYNRGPVVVNHGYYTSWGPRGSCRMPGRGPEVPWSATVT
jgi:hypothetical protein